MTMREIYLELESQQKKYAAEVEELTKKLDKARNNKDSVEMAMESLSSLGDFRPSDEEEKEVKKENKKEKKENNFNDLMWKHKNSVIIKYGLDGTKLGQYRSQKKLAEQLGVNQTSISHWMREDKQVQLEKRKFYLKYEY